MVGVFGTRQARLSIGGLTIRLVSAVYIVLATGGWPFASPFFSVWSFEESSEVFLSVMLSFPGIPVML